jgi:signal transduction histidine kinase
MEVSLLYAGHNSWLYSWPTATATILGVQLVLLLLAAGIAGVNAGRSRQAIRLFWAFLAAGLGLWALNLWFWIYYVVWLRAGTTDLSWSSPPLFLHVVLIMAAIAVRPHLKRPRQKPYRATIDFLLLLFFWVFIYAYLQLPYHHTNSELGHYIILYSAPNVVLLVFLGLLISRAHSPWKSIYWHLFGASALYALGSLGSNLDTMFHGYHAGFYEAPLIASECWFVWMTLLGRRLAPELEQRLQPDTGQTRYVSVLAMLAVVAIPAVGLWELARAGEPAQVRTLRLLIVLGSVLLLSLSALIKEYLAYHDLAADLSTAVWQRTQVEEERLKLSGRLINAQEEERSRIARDLHDDMNQRLGLLAFGLSQLSGKLPAGEAKLEIQELWQQTSGLSQDVHRLSHELHPATLEQLGLVAAARALCAEFSKKQGVEVYFTEHDVPPQLPEQVPLCLYRVLQESLQNIAKHSEASVVKVELDGGRDGVHLTVEDDGIGFDPANQGQGGLGLLSMRERLRLVGGSIRIDSAPSQGTSVKVLVPISAAESPGTVSAPEQARSSNEPNMGTSHEPRRGTFAG